MSTLVAGSVAIRGRSIVRRQRFAEHNRRRRSLPDHLTESYRVFSKQKKVYRLIQTISILVIIGGSVFGFTYLRQNQVAEDTADDIVSTALQNTENSGSNPDTPQDPVIIPSTNKPSRADVLAHTMLADQPKRIEINKIEVFARVQSVGVNKKGEVSSPINVYDTVWFNLSNKIGEKPGSSVLVGHVGFRSIAGVFAEIDELVSGDSITITMGDDRVFTYIVNEKKSLKLKDFSMSNYLSYRGSDNSKLHLITCSGSILRGSTSYDSRLVVTAELQE